ncbi:AMIN domain-containing protein, partial [Desulfovibrio sp. OttesenSCG-928-A18]|nr:AMIN domain-containing protein [Desulfovibrio sp. OttesenSCG-928-A18]
NAQEADGGQNAPGPTASLPDPAPSQSSASPGDKNSHTLLNIELRPDGRQVTLVLEADSPFKVKPFALPGPDRLVIDLPGTWRGIRGPTVPENRFVKNVRLGKNEKGPRIVLDLHRTMKHTVTQKDNVVEIVMQ